MTLAWNKLYKENVKVLPKTHTYIKIYPLSDDDLESLRQYTMKEKIAIFDFPLEYELLEMGEYYVDTKASKPELTFQYAVIPKGKIFPNVKYEIVDELVLAPDKSYLTQISFKLSGNSYEKKVGKDSKVPNLEIDKVDPKNNSIKPNCRPDSPFWPGCLELFNDRNELELKIFNPSTQNTFLNEQWCECISYDYGYEVNRFIALSSTGDCSEFEYNGNTSSTECQPYTWPPPPPPSLITNQCGCQVYANERKPGGCVRVINTNTNGLVAVRKVAIHMKDTWFNTDVTFTDDDGCWKINAEYYGSAWMWVRFYNENATIRALRLADPFDLFNGVRDYVGSISGPQFNNINVEYHPDNNVGSVAQLFWAAATTHNAVQEYLNHPDGIPVWSDLNIIYYYILTRTKPFYHPR